MSYVWAPSFSILINSTPIAFFASWSAFAKVVLYPHTYLSFMLMLCLSLYGWHAHIRLYGFTCQHPHTKSLTNLQSIFCKQLSPTCPSFGAMHVSYHEDSIVLLCNFRLESEPYLFHLKNEAIIEAIYQRPWG